MRVVISSLQQLIQEKFINTICHVPSDEQLADVFTKHTAPKAKLLDCLEDSVLCDKNRKAKSGVNTSRFFQSEEEGRI